MGLGVKILLTGVLFLALSCILMGLMDGDRDMEFSPWANLVMVLTCFAGVTAMIVGALMSIWV